VNKKEFQKCTKLIRQWQADDVNSRMLAAALQIYTEGRYGWTPDEVANFLCDEILGSNQSAREIRKTMRELLEAD
jgi:hypothetical protein